MTSGDHDKSKPSEGDSLSPEEFSSAKETWLVAVWPGMGSVAVTAGNWLSEQLGAEHQLDLPAEEFFDIEKVEVKGGIAKAGWRPNSSFSLWRNDGEGPDLLFFVGEAQPTGRGLEFCHRILEVAHRYRVTRVWTFAAMATPLQPGVTPRVFAVANEESLLAEVQAAPIEVLEDGQINGLNGVLLAAAAELGIGAVCLLGELPFFAVAVPNPRASLAVIEIFSQLSGVHVEVSELEEQSRTVDRRLQKIFENMPQVEIDLDDDEGPNFSEFEASFADPEVEEGTRLSPAHQQRLEKLFEEAAKDRHQAFALKAELDKLGVFELYEDRFLDLFREGS